MSNFVRKLYVRKNDNACVALGTLTASDTLQIEYWSQEQGIHLRDIKLSGNVIDTERNEVLVVGKMLSDGEIEVLRMVEVPEVGPIKGFNVTKGLADPIGIYSSCSFKNVEEKTTKETNKKYFSVKFSSGENATVILNSFFFNKADEADARYIFVTNGNFESSESTFTPERGENAGKEQTWKTHRGFALSQLV